MDLILQILGLAYFIFALWNLRLAVLLLPFFFSTYLLKFDLQGVPFPLVEVFIYGTFFAWILQTGRQLFKRKLHLRDLLEPFNYGWWFAVLGIVLAAVVSAFIAPQSLVMMDGTTIFYGHKVALGILKSWIIAPVLMLMLFAWVMRTGKDLALALNSYAVSSILLAGWGVCQVLSGQYLTPDARASGPFNSANYLALFITPALFYVFVVLKELFAGQQQSWWKRFFHFFHPQTYQQQRSKFFLILGWTIGFLLLLFGLLFTKSYAAFLSFFVALFLWFVFQVKDWKRFPWKTILGVVGLLVVLGLVLIALDPTKWQLFFNLTTRTSSGVRVEIYTIATRLVMEHPLFGIGLGMFPAVYQLEGPRILGQPLYELNMLHPHDEFLAFWLNLGLLGFLSFLWIIKICFQKAWRYLKTLKQSQAGTVQWFRGVGLLLLIIILVHGLVDTPFFKNDLALLFWLVVNVILLPVGKKNRE